MLVCCYSAIVRYGKIPSCSRNRSAHLLHPNQSSGAFHFGYTLLSSRCPSSAVSFFFLQVFHLQIIPFTRFWWTTHPRNRKGKF